MVKALEKTNTKGSGFSAFCKKVPKCESQTSSGEMADLSDYASKTIKNRRGPSTVPWGMPDIKHCVFDLLPLTDTLLSVCEKR